MGCQGGHLSHCLGSCLQAGMGLWAKSWSPLLSCEGTVGSLQTWEPGQGYKPPKCTCLLWPVPPSCYHLLLPKAFCAPEGWGPCFPGSPPRALLVWSISTSSAGYIRECCCHQPWTPTHAPVPEAILLESKQLPVCFCRWPSGTRKGNHPLVALPACVVPILQQKENMVTA